MKKALVSIHPLKSRTTNDWSLYDNTPVGPNWDVLVCVVALLAIGAVMVFSATTLPKAPDSA